MRVSKGGWLAIFLLLLVLWHKHGSAQAQQPQQLSLDAQQFLAQLPNQWLQNEGDLWAVGEILVGHATDQKSRTRRSARTQLGYQPETLQSLTTGNSASGAGITIERWRVPAGTEWTTLAQLQNQPGILFAEPNWRVRAAAPGAIPTATPSLTPTATSVAIISSTINASSASFTQPYVPNDPFYLDKQWYLQRINTPRALALLDTGNGQIQPLGEIIVAVIDSGIDLSHPEFQGRILPGYNFWDNSLDPDTQSCELPADTLAPVVDDFGHGTHVSGLIGAALNNQAGLASIAPFIKLQPLKILNGNGSGTVFDLATAITYAANCLHVNIINLSLEISASVLDNNPVLNNTLHTAVQDADAANVLMIAAGGNSGGTVVPYPAGYPEVMGVAALNIDNNRTSYSTSGSQIDIAAPGGESTTIGGVRIYSTWSKDAEGKCRDGSYQLVDGGAYCNDHGTSMATPLVVGAAALVWGVRPELNAHEVRDILLETATPLDLPADQVGAGRIDVHAALRRALYNNLEVIPGTYLVQGPTGVDSIPLSVRLENVSLEPLVWTGSVITGSEWISLDTVGNKTFSDTAHFSSPSFLQVILSPAALAIGEHEGNIGFDAVSSNGDPITTQLKIRMSVNLDSEQVTINDLPASSLLPISATPSEGNAEGTFIVYFPSIFSETQIMTYLPWIALNANFETTPTTTPPPTPNQLPTPTITPVIPNSTPTTIGQTTLTATPPSTPNQSPTLSPTPMPTQTPTPVPPTSAPPAVGQAPVATTFQWETPSAANARTVYTVTTDTPVNVAFPGVFSFAMRGESYSNFRIFADGYIAFPATEAGATGKNRCLLDLADPGQAIYGWWTSLDPSASGSQISTFAQGTDRFVVEFQNVPSTAISPGYTVSFQIVMFSNGDIRLNYLNVPIFNGRPAPATVGVEARDALFGFQIACSTETQVIGTLPRSGQSFLLKANYLY